MTFVFPLASGAIHPNGFGYLVPRPIDRSTNPSGILGVVFDSTALPGLDSASGITKLTVMMGGPYWSSYQPVVPRPVEAGDLAQPALTHLRSVFPALQDVEPMITATSLHKDCIPTYAPGHIDRMRQCHALVEDSHWKGKISFIGNAIGGVGVNDCVWSASQVVSGLHQGLAPTGYEGAIA